MEKPRIALFVNTMSAGGAERFVSHVIKGLRNNFETQLILLENFIEYELPADLQVVDLGSTGKKSADLHSLFRIPFVSYKLTRHCRKEGIHLVVSFLTRSNLAACLAKAFGWGAVVLISERTYTPSMYDERNLRGKIARFLVARLYPWADAILPNSRGTQAALENHYGIQSRYIVIKNIVDLDSIRSQQEEEVEDVDFDKFTFVHVGSFSYMKGHRLMVEAFAELADEDAQLLFIGKGGLEEEIKELAASLGMQKRIRFLGHKSNPFKYLGRADCFVLASDFEGFPNVLIEAMACGLPVISTDCRTGPRELLAPQTGYETKLEDRLEYAEYGMLLPVGSRKLMAAAMATMMGDDALRNSYKAKSQGRAAEYDTRVVTEEFRQILLDHSPIRNAASAAL